MKDRASTLVLKVAKVLNAIPFSLGLALTSLLAFIQIVPAITALFTHEIYGVRADANIEGYWFSIIVSFLFGILITLCGVSLHRKRASKR